MNKSIVLNTDSYKMSHWNMIPKEITYMKSYIESRNSDNNEEFPSVIFFGLQMFIKEYLKPITMNDIDLAEMLMKKHIPDAKFNRKGWEYILKEHNGELPIRINSVPEGSLIPRNRVLCTIENTDENCAWLTSYVETALLRAIWYPSSIATRDFYIKRLMKKYLEETYNGDVNNHLNFMLHDFGARGVSTFEGAGIGGLAHLVNFSGTDTISSLLFGREYYDLDMGGYSVSATEHSVMTIKGKDGEFEQLKYIIENNLHSGSILSIVADSYNIYNFCTEHLKNLKDLIIQSGGKVVVRPDSGVPEIVDVEVLEMLGETFGFTINSKGYKELPPYIGTIQGDGIDFDTIDKILSSMKDNKWSANNIVFGSGGWLLQKVNRDTFNFAMKACYAEDDSGKKYDIFKSPVHGGKNSLAGDLFLVKRGEEFINIVADDIDPKIDNIFMEIAYEDGEFYVEDFETIKRTVENQL